MRIWTRASQMKREQSTTRLKDPNLKSVSKSLYDISIYTNTTTSQLAQSHYCMYIIFFLSFSLLLVFPAEKLARGNSSAFHSICMLFTLFPHQFSNTICQILMKLYRSDQWKVGELCTPLSYFGSMFFFLEVMTLWGFSMITKPLRRPDTFTYLI